MVSLVAHITAALAPAARSSALRIAAASLWSLVLWGSWGALANAAHGPLVAARAGLTQGAISLAVTCLMTALLEAVSGRCVGRWTRILAPAAAAEAFHAGVTISLHAWAGTPELALTTAPLIAAGIVYALVYAATLARHEAPPSRRIVQGARRSSQVELSAPFISDLAA